MDLDADVRDPVTGDVHDLGIVRAVHGRDDHRVKAGKGRDVPMTPRLRDAMREHFARFRFATYDGDRTPWIFHHRHRNRGQHPGDRIQSLKRPLFDAADRAGLPDRFWQHDLRHRRATTWLAAGKSPVKVQKALGHADLETTMRYYQYVRGHLASLVDMGDGNSAELRHLLRQLIDAIENGDGDAVAGLVS